VCCVPHGRSETYLGKSVATAMNDSLGLGENIIKCGVNVTVVYLSIKK
jgi:hypothetical protein